MKKIHFSPMTCAVAASLLVGCGEGESNSPDPVVPPTEMKAMAVDGFSVVMPEENTQIDLNRYLRVPDARVTNVIYQGENPDCGDPTVVDGGFQVRLGTGALCDYRYTAQYNQVSSDASFRVLASADESPFLPSLSKSLVVDTDPLSVNLQTELGANWPSGYALDTVTLVGDLNQGSVTKGAGNTLTYTLRSTAGWDTIEYTLKNTVDEKKVKTGSIFVTVSDEANQAPTITSPKYDFSAANPDTMVTVGNSLDINLASRGIGITDADGDPWQLVHVQSFSATVAAKNPDSTTNKVITFTAHNIGEHIVSYIVSDNYGGYASGLVKVNVDVESEPRAWTDITSGAGYLFSAPPTYVEAAELGVVVSAIKDTKVNNTVALFKENAAVSYCATSGYIPTELEFGELWASRWKTDGTGQLNTWPQGGPGQSGLYLVQSNDRTDYKQFDIKTGEAVAYANQPVYLTCLMNTTFRLEPVTSTVVANGVRTTVSIAHKPTSGSVLVNPTKVSGTLSDAHVDVSFGAQEGRNEEVEVKSSTVGTYQFSLDVQGSSETAASQVIRFVGDAETAAARIPADTRVLPNGVSGTEVIVNVSDMHGNALTDYVITLTSTDASDVITPAKAVTSAGGQAVFTVVSRTSGARTLEVIRSKGNDAIGSAVVTASPRKYKETATANGLQWRFETVDNDNLADTVVVPAGTTFTQNRPLLDTIMGTVNGWFWRGAAWIEPADTNTVVWWGNIPSHVQGMKQTEASKECLSALLAAGHEVKDGDQIYIGWNDGPGAHNAAQGRSYCAVGMNFTDVHRCSALTNGAPGRRCVDLGKGAAANFYIYGQKVYDRGMVAIRSAVPRDTYLNDFLTSCTGTGSASATTNFTIAKPCSQLSTVGPLPWAWGQTFTVEGKLQNNLGMQLGTLP